MAAPCLLELGHEESSISDAQAQIESAPSIQAPLLSACVSRGHMLPSKASTIHSSDVDTYWVPGFILGIGASSEAETSKGKSVPSWGR